MADHLASLATTLSRASLAKRLAAIGQYHRLAGHAFASHPVIHHTLRDIHRKHGRPARPPVRHVGQPKIRRRIDACRTRSLANLRDRALLLLLGYAGALRRAELVAVEREHVAFTPKGVRSQIPRSKTNTPTATNYRSRPVRLCGHYRRPLVLRFGSDGRRVD